MSEKPKKLAVACGGTGGHFYPGLSIAKAFKAQGGNAMLFVGGHHTDEHVELAKASGVDAIAVPAVRLPRSPVNMVLFPFKMWSSIGVNAQKLKEYEIDIALVMGSWASIPMGLAANRLKIPLALHEGNAVPGQANRFLSRKAKLIGLSLPLRDPLNTAAKQISVGMPLRQEIIDASVETVDDARRAAICDELNLNPANPVCLVFGGSQGARAINDAIVTAMPDMSQADPPWQLIHLTGQEDNSALETAAKDAGLNAVIRQRDSNIHRLYQIADAIICRAGASTILELAVMAKYPLLIPLPTAKEDHQTANAQCVVSTDGGSMVPQSELSNETIMHYLGTAMEKNQGDNPGVNNLAFPNAAEGMVSELMML